MSDVYEIWLYPLQDWWRTVNEMSDFMSTGQTGNFIFRPVFYPSIHPATLVCSLHTSLQPLCIPEVKDETLAPTGCIPSTI